MNNIAKIRAKVAEEQRIARECGPAGCANVLFCRDLLIFIDSLEPEASPSEAPKASLEAPMPPVRGAK